MDGIWAHSGMGLWCCLMNASEIAEANVVPMFWIILEFLVILSLNKISKKPLNETKCLISQMFPMVNYGS